MQDDDPSEDGGDDSTPAKKKGRTPIKMAPPAGYGEVGPPTLDETRKGYEDRAALRNPSLTPLRQSGSAGVMPVTGGPAPSEATPNEDPTKGDVDLLAYGQRHGIKAPGPLFDQTAQNPGGVDLLKWGPDNGVERPGPTQPQTESNSPLVGGTPTPPAGTSTPVTPPPSPDAVKANYSGKPLPSKGSVSKLFGAKSTKANLRRTGLRQSPYAVA